MIGATSISMGLPERSRSWRVLSVPAKLFIALVVIAGLGTLIYGGIHQSSRVRGSDCGKNPGPQAWNPRLTVSKISILRIPLRDAFAPHPSGTSASYVSFSKIS